VSFGDDGVATVECSLGYVGTPAAANFAGLHTVRVLARDPWAAAAEPSSTRLDVLNRAPTALPQTYAVSAACGSGSCCLGLPSDCDEYYTTYLATTVHAQGFVTDPDGDPLTVTSSVGATVCEPPACELDVRMGSGQVCSLSGAVEGSAPYSASDGAATLSAGVTISLACQ
jgi:hypothetical protein